MSNRNQSNPTRGGSLYADSELELDGSAAEAEIKKVQRNLRVLEAERKAYAEKSRNTIGSQSATLDKLRRDHEFLEQELRILRLQMMDDEKNGAGSEKAEALKHQIEYSQKKIKETLTENSSIERKLGEVEKQYAKKRAALGSAPKQPADGSNKQIAAMANRLDKTLVRFNKMIEGNEKLREQIDIMRYERLAFNGVYKRYERELLDMKTAMNDIIQSSTAAYEAREDAQNRMIALKERAEKEHQVYLQELKELERRIHQDRKLRDFMAKKTTERGDYQLKPKNQGNVNNGTKISQESIVQRLEEFNLDRKDLDQTTIDDLIDRFVRLEEENFSLFNYVNELNNQIASYSDDVSAMDVKTRRVSVKPAIVDQQRQEKADKLGVDIDEIKAKTGNFKHQSDSLELTLGDVVADIDSLYSTLGLPAIEEASVQTIIEKEELVLQKMQAIEDKTNELLMKNMLAGLPRKMAVAASANPDKEKDKEAEGVDSSQDAAFLTTMLNNLRRQSIGTETSDAIQMKPVIGAGPDAPVGAVKVDNSVLSGDEGYGLDEFSDLEERPFTRDEIQKKTVDHVLRRLSSKKAELEKMSAVQLSTSKKAGGKKPKRGVAVKR